MTITDSRLAADVDHVRVAEQPGLGDLQCVLLGWLGRGPRQLCLWQCAIGLTNDSRTIVNGNLTDTISDVSLGVQIYTNEINILLGGCDADDDGYERRSCGGTNCDDDDPWVNPAAVEIPYDGVDNDCDGFATSRMSMAMATTGTASAAMTATTGTRWFIPLRSRFPMTVWITTAMVQTSRMLMATAMTGWASAVMTARR